MKRILVVDDEVEICNILVEFLTIKGHLVFTAISGEEALCKVAEEKPQVVLLDIKMAGMDGMEVLRQIKQNGGDVCVIMITAIKDEVMVQKALEMGADDYMTKPFELDHLERNIRRSIIQRIG